MHIIIIQRYKVVLTNGENTHFLGRFSRFKKRKEKQCSYVLLPPPYLTTNILIKSLYYDFVKKKNVLHTAFEI